ncbi:hypothetical protein QBC33DRAFT_596574 [Phialemonium atrogriseum]|uniref:Nephrocystin 3-like N-terminal domain-containing protein n=1 Tax=Phialemonium atrogriseum TaxID=1093897 RepID=A0AAJ0BVI6_9PEZI|nr:uncharacterized protein QBC33DRAFT_596574 [Phialemonium atrogriseum]KAK1763849.1 hypothetical protein QBC33DRAFT_596574 [Phialemonium atrogriseum]
MNAKIPATGLTVILDPSEPDLDIVFVHGFNGHPERTWTHKSGADDGESEPPTNAQGRGLRPRSTSRRAIYWPRDLLRTSIPEARVLTYGYDANIRHIAGKRLNQNSVYDIASNFLVELEAQRRLAPTRRLIFIAHSLGGIVVKEMLRRSSGQHDKQAHLGSICDATVGVVFFGTPHQGADPRRLLQKVAEAATRALGFTVNQQVVEALLPSSERLRELRDEFGPMARHHGWVIHSFQESLGIRVLEGRKAVEDTSSYINLPEVETSQHIGRDHMDMCRFTGLLDPEFKKVEAALRRMVTQSPGSQRPHNDPSKSVTEYEKERIMNALTFDRADFRRTAIKSAHTKTCRWILTEPVYVQWLDLSKLNQHYGLLWIKGKPGTGKSTVMKFAFSHTQKTMKDRIVISFFFNARGDYLERSTEGMYRSLLTQLLQHIPDGKEDMINALGQMSTMSSSQKEWSVKALEDVFQQIILALDQASVVCFIDALDECDEREMRETVSFFENLSDSVVESHINFEVCLTSRHYPHISIGRGYELVLESHKGHVQDITTYIDGKLKIGASERAQNIRLDLQKKAAGVFMWVVLVVDILNKEYDSGRIHGLQARLAELPDDLHGLFRDIMTRDDRNPQGLLHFIQWILFSSRPLTPEELYFALLLEASEEFGEVASDEITSEVQHRFILDHSKGLAEIVQSKGSNPTVQFIHEAVRDFFLHEDGLADFWPDFGSNLLGPSHDYLRQSCAAYISYAIPAVVDPNLIVVRDSAHINELCSRVTTASPFLRYAVQNVLYHGDKAQEAGIDQRTFLEGFPRANWIWLSNLFEEHEFSRHTTKASLLYILAATNMDNLIAVWPDNLSYLAREPQRYGVPFVAAMATESRRSIRRFLELEVQSQPGLTTLVKLYNLYRSRGHNHPICGPNIRFPQPPARLSFFEHFPRRDGLLLAFLVATNRMECSDSDESLKIIIRADWDRPAEYSEAMILAGVLERGRASQGVIGKALIRSLELGCHDFTRRLLDPNNKSPFWGDSSNSPRRLGASNVGHGISEAEMGGALSGLSSPPHRGPELQKLASDLLRHVDLNVTDWADNPLLSVAAKVGNEPVVRLLLATGQVDVNKGNDHGQSPLTIAADPDMSSKGETPLLAAYRLRRTEVVKLLLDTGKVNVNTQTRTGHTLLMMAVERKDYGIAQLLLATGKADITIRVKDSKMVDMLLENSVDAKDSKMEDMVPDNSVDAKDLKMVDMLLDSILILS